MYKSFYNLTRNPFELSPDPYFYYATERHNEALAILIYAAVRRKGFVVVTGPKCPPPVFGANAR